MMDIILLKRAIKVVLDSYLLFISKEDRPPTSEELATILFYELELSNLEEAYNIIEYLNYIGFLLYKNNKYEVNLDFFYQ